MLLFCMAHFLFVCVCNALIRRLVTIFNSFYTNDIVVLLLFLLAFFVSKIHGACDVWHFILIPSLSLGALLFFSLTKTLFSIDLQYTESEREREYIIHRESIVGSCKWALYRFTTLTCKLFVVFIVVVVVVVVIMLRAVVVVVVVNFVCAVFFFFSLLQPFGFVQQQICGLVHFVSVILCIIILCFLSRTYVVVVVHVHMHIFTKYKHVFNIGKSLFSLFPSIYVCVYVCVLICPENIIALHWFISHSSLLLLFFCIFALLYHTHPHTQTYIFNRSISLLFTLCLSLD